MTEEQWTKKTNAGIRRYDIIMGIDAFYGLVDGVEFDYANGKFVLSKELLATTAPPNYMRVEGKPAITIEIGEQHYPVFMDTGSPRHVFTKPMIAAVDTLSSFTDRYGSYEYQVFTLRMNRLLNLNEVTLEAANYARRSSSEKFNISAHFGSFPNHRVRYHLEARRVEILKD